MKKIIDGKLYDTDKAVEVCGYEYGYSTDFRYEWEYLYKSAKGAYFIHGGGGALSKYRREVAQNEWSGGGELRLVSGEEAKAFVEAHGSTEDYVECFGEPEEG